MTQTVNINGVGKVNFPDDYSPERIQFAIEKDILPRLKAKPEKPQDMTTPEAPTKLERFGRGMADVVQGVKQGGLMLKDLFTGGNEADAYTKEKTDELALYEKGRGDAGVDWMRLGGNVVATLPAMAIPGGGAASLGTRAAAGAAQGAASSAAMFTPEGDSKTAQIVTGGAVGGAFPVVAQGVRAGAGRIADLVRGPKAVNLPAIEGELVIKLQQQGLNWNTLTQNVRDSLLKDAQGTLQAGGTLDDAMLRNKALIESVGAKPTKASVTRAPRDWQTEKNLRGIQGAGDGIVRREQENATAMVEYLGKLRGSSGGKPGTALDVGESAVKALRAQDEAKRKVVTDLYETFRATGNETAQVPNVKIADAVGRVADDFGFENIPGPVVSRLKEFGFVSGGGMHGGALEAGFKEGGKLLTVKEADKLSRLINNNNPGPGTPGAKALQVLKNALDESLLDVEGNGAQALLTARKAAAQRFAEQRAGSGIMAAVDDVAPDRFVQKFILNAPTRDMKATLGELAKTADGKQAIADVKGHLLDSFLLKATGASGVDDVVGKPFSGARFGKALDAIEPEKLHAIFSPAELESLRTLQKASKLLTQEVPFSDVNHSKTAAALANLLQKVGSTPLLGQIVAPILGVAKVGADWVKDATARKQVAEALMSSAGKAGAKPALAAPTTFERLAPGAAGALAYPSERPNK